MMEQQKEQQFVLQFMKKQQEQATIQQKQEQHQILEQLFQRLINLGVLPRVSVNCIPYFVKIGLEDDLDAYLVFFEKMTSGAH